jgi:DNA-binding transcriptional MerR regulator
MGDGEILVKVGQLAKRAGIFPSKVRYYVNEGLLNPLDRTRGGYYLFDESGALERLRLIEKLRTEERLSLDEIKQKISKGTDGV